MNLLSLNSHLCRIYQGFVMNINIHPLDSRVKKEAKRLHATLKLVLPHTDCLNQLEPSFKSPTLKQCYEIIAHGYGFNTYNGLCSLSNDDKTAISLNDFNTKRMENSLAKFLIRENVNHSSGIVEIINIIDNPDVLGEIITDVGNVLPYLRAYPTVDKIKIPNRFYSLEFIFEWTGNESKYFINKLHEVTFNVIFSTIIENYEQLEFIEFENTTMFGVPISFFYPHKINDIHKVRDVVIDLEDLLNSSNIIKASSGHLDFDKHQDSMVNITMSRELAQQLKLISNVIKIQNLANQKIDALLDMYIKHYNSAFQTFFRVACITSSPFKRLLGNDIVKYQIVKRMYFKILLNSLGLPDRSIYACKTVEKDSCKIEDVVQQFKNDSLSITNAVIELDKQYAKVILPFIEKYIELQTELLHLVKPLFSISFTGESLSSKESKDSFMRFFAPLKKQIDRINSELIQATVTLSDKI